MARNTTLGDLVTKLKAESGHSSNVNLGIDKTEHFKQTLRRVQEQLYYEYDWPFLRVIVSITLNAGQRFYDFPNASAPKLDFDRIEEVVVNYSGQPHQVARGIGFEHYAQYEPADNERSDPVRAWDVRWNADAAPADEQIEVWPLPASGDMTLRLQGIRQLRALTSDTDRADLDDNLIVLFAAAEILARQESTDAEAKLRAAQSLFSRLKGRTRGGSGMAVYGGGEDYRKKKHATIIRVS